jgi:hypothetical protein
MGEAQKKKSLTVTNSTQPRSPARKRDSRLGIGRQRFSSVGGYAASETFF